MRGLYVSRTMFPTGRNRDAHINNTSFSSSSKLQLKSYNKMSQKDPCQKQACAIQKCLQANKYIESRCEDVILAMKKCCEAHAGENSVCCSGFTKDITSTKTTTACVDISE